MNECLGANLLDVKHMGYFTGEKHQPIRECSNSVLTRTGWHAHIVTFIGNPVSISYRTRPPSSLKIQMRIDPGHSNTPRWMNTAVEFTPTQFPAKEVRSMAIGDRLEMSKSTRSLSETSAHSPTWIRASPSTLNPCGSWISTSSTRG